MAETKNCTGGCHCGNVRFDVNVDLTQVLDCNCSICKKRGALWAFAPGDKFALRAGDEALTDYQFGKKTIHHLFCAQCGVGAFSRGQTPVWMSGMPWVCERASWLAVGSGASKVLSASCWASATAAIKRR